MLPGGCFLLVSRVAEHIRPTPWNNVFPAIKGYYMLGNIVGGKESILLSVMQSGSTMYRIAQLVLKNLFCSQYCNQGEQCGVVQRGTGQSNRRLRINFCDSAHVENQFLRFSENRFSLTPSSSKYRCCVLTIFTALISHLGLAYQGIKLLGRGEKCNDLVLLLIL